MRTNVHPTFTKILAVTVLKESPRTHGVHFFQLAPVSWKLTQNAISSSPLWIGAGMSFSSSDDDDDSYDISAALTSSKAKSAGQKDDFGFGFGDGGGASSSSKKGKSGSAAPAGKAGAPASSSSRDRNARGKRGSDVDTNAGVRKGGVIDFGGDDDEPDSEEEKAEQRRQQQQKKKAKSGGFQSMSLAPAVFKGVMGLGYRVPTPIQRQAIPVLLTGQADAVPEPWSYLPILFSSFLVCISLS